MLQTITNFGVFVVGSILNSDALCNCLKKLKIREAYEQNINLLIILIVSS